MSSDEMSRREFAGAAAMAVLLPFVAASPVSLPVPARGRAGTFHVTEDPSALAKSLAEAVRGQYGDRLSADDLATVTRQIQAGLERAARLRAPALENGTGPDAVFSAVRRRA